MMSSTQMIQVASTTLFSPLVKEKISTRITGTMKPAMSAPRLNFGYSSAKRLARSSIASR